MPIRRFPTYLGFAAWVSVCAAAPEFIWQGMLSLLGHFTRHNLYAIILIGLILAVFVEPILERAREGRWTSEHRSTRSLLLTAPVAVIFGMAAVGLHECMTAYLGGGHSGPDDGVAQGFRLILEWAGIPLAVTLAWFGGRLNPRAAIFAAAAAGIAIAAIGWFFAWPWRDIVMTSIPCIAMIPLGQIYLRRNWHEDTFDNLAIGLAGFTAVWLLLTRLLQTVPGIEAVTGFPLYGVGDLGSDFRFYLGWAIGLALAPNPVPADARPGGGHPGGEPRPAPAIGRGA